MMAYLKLLPVPWAEQIALQDPAAYKTLQLMAAKCDEYGRGVMSILQLVIKSGLWEDKLFKVISFLKDKKIVIFINPCDPGLIYYMLRVNVDPHDLLK